MKKLTMFYVSFLFVIVSFLGLKAENYSLYLDGIDDYLDVNFPILNNASEGTIECWAKVIDTKNGYKNLIFYGSENDGMRGIQLRMTSDYRPFLSYYNGAGIETMIMGNPVELSTWHLYSGQWRDSYMELFVDGQLVASGEATVDLSNLNSKVRIGRMNNGYGPTNIYIHSVRILNTFKYSGNFTDLILSADSSLCYLPISEGEGNIVNDFSGNGYNGNIFGATWSTDVPSETSLEQIPSYLPTDGLLGWWPFNGNANDESENENNGTVYGALLTEDRFENPNSAYSFDYTNWSWGSGGDEIYIPFSETFNSENISVSVWVEPTSVHYPGQGLTIIDRWEYGYSTPHGEVWGLSLMPDTYQFRSWISSDIYGDGYEIVGPEIPNHIWTHLVFTYDGEYIRQYVNGLLDTTTSTDNLILNIDGNSGISIGVSDQANGNWWPYDGKIDDIGIWNRALTEEEIVAIYNSEENQVENYSLYFKNTSNPADNVYLGNPTWSNSICSGSLTMEAWIKVDSCIYLQRIISKDYVFKFSLGNDEDPYYRFGGYLGGESQEIFSSYPNDSDWHHVAIVGNAENNTLNLFLDGIQTNSTYYSTVALSNSNSVNIGSRNGQWESFIGNIYAVRVSDNARYVSNFTPTLDWINDSNTVGLWYLNKGSGTTVEDLSINNITGTITGATWSTEYPKLINPNEGEDLTWSIQLKASQNTLIDHDNYLGVAEGATDNFDTAFDDVEPPLSPGSSISLYFLHEEWNTTLGNKFCKDIRNEIDLTDIMQVWDFNIVSTETGEVTLSFPFYGVPDVPVIFEDTLANVKQSINSGYVYSYSAEANDIRSFRISVGDTSAPEITLGFSCTGPAILQSNSLKTLDWVVTDGYSVDSLELWYSEENGLNYSKIITLGHVDAYDWTVPDATIIYNGLLKLKAKDFAGNISSKTSDHVFAVAGDSLINTVDAGWNLWGVPLIPENENMSINLVDDFNDYWVSFDYLNNGYAEADILQIAKGYWLGSFRNTVIDIIGTPVTESYSMSLQPGWSLVSNPLVLDVCMDSLLFTKLNDNKLFSEAQSAGWINTVYSYIDSAGYFYINNLSPWRGYWISVLDTGITVTFPIHKNPIEPDKKSKESIQEISFLAEAGNVRHEILHVGIHKDATYGFDPLYDAITPPNPPSEQYVSLYVPRPDLNLILGNNFAKDIRGPITEDGYEEYFIKLSSSEPLALITWNLDAISSELEIGIDVNENGIYEDMRKLESVTVENGKGFSVRIGNNVVGTLSDLIPQDYAIDQNYPNPFNPNTIISYAIPQAGHVKLEIYDLTGRRVCTLINQHQTAGYKSIVWNGRNEFGDAASTGIYFYRIIAGDFTQTKKMVFMK